VPKKNCVGKTRIVSSEGPRGKDVPSSPLKDQRATRTTGRLRKVGRL